MDEDIARSSFSDRVTAFLLSSCAQDDIRASVSSVVRDCSGRTVVRLKSGEGQPCAGALLKRLKVAMPLSKTCVVENHMNGTLEAEVVVPNERDEWCRSMERARSGRLVETMNWLSLLLVVVGVVLYVVDGSLPLHS